ncbi:hypothetical protein Poli38472_010719 [Pythium oligandrum]|uniref:Uncharacterized protein n=1 Tax=Pythium oligandrum TaxID=41045 RepID=A0A8K1CDY9_PYTOL|nr:hypothetical protein Poli38472_010719 [Pythium oligandrum]|eukprot:TMW61656.1 hypothetical protein Poli38472_010719 [Pythium oligandrum]
MDEELYALELLLPWEEGNGDDDALAMSIGCELAQEQAVDSRRSKKEEVLFLRATVEELESKLRQLQSTDDQSSQLQPGDLACAAWKDLTRRQLLQRRRAEMENARLRVLLREQILVAKNLSRALAKNQADIEAFAFSSQCMESVRPCNSASPLAKSTLIDELVESTNAMRTQTNEVLADARFNTDRLLERPIREARLCRDLTRGSYLEIVEGRAFPYEFRKVSNDFWQALHLRPKMPNPVVEEKWYLSEHSFAKRFACIMAMERSSCQMHGRSVVRRFIESDRVVIVATVLAEPERVVDTVVNGVVVRHQTWHVFRPLGNGLTAFQSYHTAAPQVYDTGSNNVRHVGLVTNFLLSAVDFYLEFGQQMVEDRLLLEEIAAAEAQEDERIE